MKLNSLAIAALFLALPVTGAQQYTREQQQKYVSNELGFAVAFPGQAVRSQQEDGTIEFTSANSDKTWWCSVAIVGNVDYVGPVNKNFMDEWIKGRVRHGTMNPTSAFRYSTLQGYPTASAETTAKRPSDAEVLVGKVMYVFVKSHYRIYVVFVWSKRSITLPGKEQQAQTAFMDSFEVIRQPFE